jgi:hypothetical protein
VVQTKYYQESKSRRSGKQWTIAVITKLWDIAWDLWEFRNSVYHQQINQSTQEDILLLDEQFKELISSTALIGLLPKDQHLTEISASRLQTFSRIRKVEWIRQVTLALAQAKNRHFQLRRSRYEHYWRHQNMIESMRQTIQSWLNTH